MVARNQYISTFLQFGKHRNGYQRDLNACIQTFNKKKDFIYVYLYLGFDKYRRNQLYSSINFPSMCTRYIKSK